MTIVDTQVHKWQHLILPCVVRIDAQLKFWSFTLNWIDITPSISGGRCAGQVKILGGPHRPLLWSTRRQRTPDIDQSPLEMHRTSEYFLMTRWGRPLPPRWHQWSGYRDYLRSAPTIAPRAPLCGSSNSGGSRRHLPANMTVGSHTSSPRFL